jgi:hypothetical protein
LVITVARALHVFFVHCSEAFKVIYRPDDPSSKVIHWGQPVDYDDRRSIHLAFFDKKNEWANDSISDYALSPIVEITRFP